VRPLSGALRWLGTTTLGRSALAVLALLGALAGAFHAGERRARAAERARRAELELKARRKQEEIEDEIRALPDDQLARRATRWLR
jgi:hypothetical protein